MGYYLNLLDISIHILLFDVSGTEYKIPFYTVLFVLFSLKNETVIAT